MEPGESPTKRENLWQKYQSRKVQSRRRPCRSDLLHINRRSVRSGRFARRSILSPGPTKTRRSPPRSTTLPSSACPSRALAPTPAREVIVCNWIDGALGSRISGEGVDSSKLWGASLRREVKFTSALVAREPALGHSSNDSVSKRLQPFKDEFKAVALLKQLNSPA